MLHPVYIIHETNEYGKFHFDPANRPVDPAHLKRLTDSIRRKNLLAEFPIVVDADMTVLDGQHRLRAAEALGVSIFYVVSASMKQEDVPSSNDDKKTWRLEDHLHAYTVKKRPEYLLLKAFVEEFPGIHLSDAIWLCHYPNGTGKRGLREQFARGLYACDNLHFARTVASVLMEFKPHLPTHYCQRQFVYAIQHLVSDPRYDHGRMTKKLATYGYKLQPRVSAADYFPLLNMIYNYRLRGDDEVVEFTFRQPRRKANKQN